MSQKADAVRDLIRRKRCRDSLHSFAANIDIPTSPRGALLPDEDLTGPARGLFTAHHAAILGVCQRTVLRPFGRAIIMAPPGSAKALALDTPIPTPGGWTTMGALQAGGQVFDETGAVCNVTWKSPVFPDRPVYRVITDCGDTIVADHEHEWRAQLDRKGAFHIHETHVIGRKRSKRALVERAQALKLPPRELPVDPYLLGVWLGDGTSSSVSITSGVQDQPWLRAEIERLGYTTTDRSHPTLFGVTGIRAQFVEMGLINDPWHNVYGSKHIPAAYMRASEAQRLALLQGLVDTDGTVCKKRGCATFCNTNLELALQFRELVRSLGVKAGWSEGRATLYGKDCGPVYHISFYHAEAARMPRKRALCRAQYRTPDTYIEAWFEGVADTVCISVDSPSHLFLCGRSMTPTHNSTYVSVVTPPWALGRSPGHRIIVTSYASTLAQRQSRRARQIAASQLYRDLWDEAPEIVKDADPEWTLSNGSELLAAGITAGITGNRANGAVIDDPVAGREEADSPAMRRKILDAYQDDLMTRLLPGAWVILVMTRWNEADLAGEILPYGYKGESGMVMCRDNLWWEVLNIPAKAERADDPIGRQLGEYLWTEYYPPKHWQMFEFGVGAERQRTWSSLYQQRPTPQGSGQFTREMIRYYDEVPESARSMSKFVCSDFAVTEGKNDFTEHGVWGVTSDDDLYAMDWWYKQSNTGESVDKLLELIDRHGIHLGFNEGGVIDKAIRPLIETRIRDWNARASKDNKRRLFLDLRSLPSMQDKMAKLSAFQGRAAVGKVWFPRRAPWTERVIDQLLAMPAGRWDDAADVCGLAGRGLTQYHPPQDAPTLERRDGIKPYTAAWIEYEDDKKPAIRYR